MIMIVFTCCNNYILFLYFQGDSGGPLVCEDGKAYGVVSASSNSMLDGLKLYSYIKISDKRDWIDSVIDHHRKW